MSETAATASNRRVTTPFVALLARSLAICWAGGAVFGTILAFTLGAVSQQRSQPADELSLIMALPDVVVLFVLGSGWALLLTIPIGIPAGAIGAGLMWRIRLTDWAPSTRKAWAFLGGATGAVVGPSLGALISVLGIGELGVVVLLAAGTGVVCGALLAWMASPELIKERKGRITTGCS